METEAINYTFQTDSEIVREKYKSDNYLIEYNDKYKHIPRCIIYFSSHDIYYPNTELAFKNRILEKDYYEMYHTRIEKAYKHIFIRDIQKQWYIAGINDRINTPQLLLEFLKEETKGYQVVTLGSSAGGYAAVLYGSLLFAQFVLSFNGQFELETLLNTSNPEIDPLLFRNRKSELSLYYNLRNFTNRKVNVYYFTSIKSSWDNQQFIYFKDVESLKPVLFNTSHHGVPFVKSALHSVINMKIETLNSISNKKFNPLFFSIKYGGLVATILILFNQVLRKLKN
jgi:hypothetical protein